jgi:ribosomal protein L22
LAFARSGESSFSIFNLFQSLHPRTHASICSNNTIAQSYLSQVLSLINNLQVNSSYNSILQLQSANFVSYLQNTTNQALLSTNCTTFVTDLKAAKSADQEAERTRQKIASKIEKEFQQVARNATDNRPNELDSDEHEGRRY